MSRQKQDKRFLGVWRAGPERFQGHGPDTPLPGTAVPAPPSCPSDGVTFPHQRALATPPGPMPGGGASPAAAGQWRARTHAEHEVVVGLAVDVVQDTEHLDGEVGQRAEVGGDGLLGLDVSRRGRHVGGDGGRGAGQLPSVGAQPTAPVGPGTPRQRDGPPTTARSYARRQQAGLCQGFAPPAPRGAPRAPPPAGRKPRRKRAQPRPAPRRPAGRPCERAPHVPGAARTTLSPGRRQGRQGGGGPLPQGTEPAIIPWWGSVPSLRTQRQRYIFFKMPRFLTFLF